MKTSLKTNSKTQLKHPSTHSFSSYSRITSLSSRFRTLGISQPRDRGASSEPHYLVSQPTSRNSFSPICPTQGKVSQVRTFPCEFRTLSTSFSPSPKSCSSLIINPNPQFTHYSTQVFSLLAN